MPLLMLDAQSTERMKRQLLPKAFSPESLLKEKQALGWKPLLVIGATNYTEALSLKVYTAQRSKEDKVKNPVRLVNAVDELLKTDQPEVLRFYAALTKYQSEYRNVTPVSEMEPQQFVEEMAGIKAVLANPQGFPVYRHSDDVSQSVTSASLEEVKLDPHGISLSLDVHQTGPFYEITGTVEAFNKQIPVDRLKLVYRYFVLYGDQLTLIDHFDYLRTIDFLKLNNGKIVIHASKFDAFRLEFLAPLESKVTLYSSRRRSNTAMWKFRCFPTAIYIHSTKPARPFRLNETKPKSNSFCTKCCVRIPIFRSRKATSFSTFTNRNFCTKVGSWMRSNIGTTSVIPFSDSAHSKTTTSIPTR